MNTKGFPPFFGYYTMTLWFVKSRPLMGGFCFPVSLYSVDKVQ